MAIRLVVDSASEFTPEEAKKLGIYSLPLTITFGEESFLDREEITNEEFYNRLVSSKELPKTSQVTPYQYKQAYKEIIENGDTPFVIALCSKVSGTYNSAVMASNEFDEKIYIFDTLNGSIGGKIFTYYAMELMKEIDDPEVLFEKLMEKRDKLKIYYLLDTLEYIYKGGRISKFSALAGTILSVKPVLTLVNGLVELVGKARGFKKGNSLLTEIILKDNDIDQDMPYMLTYSGNDPSLLDYFLDNNCSELFDKNPREVEVTNLGSTIGTHMGPRTIGVSFFVK